MTQSGRPNALDSVLRRLENTEFSIKATGVAYRVINNWDSKGLLSDSRLNPQDWRKFNWFELTWVRLIAEMRCFGLGLEQIGHVRDWIFQEAEGATWSQFHEAVMRCLSDEKQLFLSVTAKGASGIFESIPLMEESAIVIPLHHLVQQVLNEEAKMEAKAAAESKLDEDLRKAIRLIRENDFEKIILSFHSGRPIIHRKGEAEAVRKEILDILPGETFKRVMILREGGKVFARVGNG
jgi:DNA-binding transcriptional MerR regulator